VGVRLSLNANYLAKSKIGVCAYARVAEGGRGNDYLSEAEAVDATEEAAGDEADADDEGLPPDEEAADEGAEEDAKSE